MQKVEKNYSLFCGYIDTVNDFIEDKNDRLFIPVTISYLDKNSNIKPEFFEALLTEKEYNILKENPYLEFETFHGKDERGKAALFDYLMNRAEENCTTDLTPIAPLTYILPKDEYVLDIDDTFQQTEELKIVLLDHIIERGYLEELREEFDFFFSSFSI